ncbi:Rv2175c family DNA-binding protein [Gordonia sp. DT30]|uniref:Rv2175c family DNA-binding protein n=1 Tax=unclassified Gordonia (in: high G+C Gram-positive bacteria) TaxID=2657482 RepID=UPI003CF2CA16
MSSLPLSPDIIPTEADTYSLDEVADRLGVSTSRVRTLIRDHRLLAISRDGQPVVPRLFFDDLGIAKHFTGLVDVLMDGGFGRDEAIRWLFTVQEDLDMHPAAALHTHSAREVIRRAQAQAF